MKVVVMNYADEVYKKTQNYNTFTALKIGKANEVFSYSPDNIDEKFYQKNKNILSIKRGNGLWLWKPYFVKKSLEKINYGDILFYADSGLYFTKKIDKVINILSDFDIVCFDIPLLEDQFTKKNVFEKMKCNDLKYKKTNQIIATYFILKKTKFVEQFIDEWLELCCDYDLICPSNGLNEEEQFISHREDQSIFSLLCKKYNITPFNDISQRYYFPKSYKYKNYIYKKPIHKKQKLPVILYLHKNKEVTKLGIFKHKIKMILSIFR